MDAGLELIQAERGTQVLSARAAGCGELFYVSSIAALRTQCLVVGFRLFSRSLRIAEPYQSMDSLEIAFGVRVRGWAGWEHQDCQKP